MSSYSFAKKVGLITILAIIFVLLFIAFKIVSIHKEKQKDENSYLVYSKEDFDISINGSFLEYVSINEEYKETGIMALDGDEDISDDVIIAYFSNGEQVFYVDTTRVGSYLVKYTVTNGNKVSEVYKTIIVVDNKKPVITVPKKTIISVNEVSDFDLEKDVMVSDNSGSFKLNYDNTLKSKVGKYIITYVATDDSNNKNEKKRIIEVK